MARSGHAQPRSSKLLKIKQRQILTSKLNGNGRVGGAGNDGFFRGRPDTVLSLHRSTADADRKPSPDPIGLPPSSSCEASRLRQELSARALRWAEEHGFPYEPTLGSSPSILYRPDGQGRHGNFHPASYRRIVGHPDWRRRLLKTHTTARKSLASHDGERRELDCCNSSDALLMSVFCHPSASGPRSATRSYLGVEPSAPLIFGYKPRTPLKTGLLDRTEVDLRIGDLLIEAKLTEVGFQTARWDMAERYRDFADIFDPDLLPRTGDKLPSYQLVRGVLAAFAEPACRYCLLCDQRRRDLIELWLQILAAIRPGQPRWRCLLLTWQELSAVLPRGLRVWLEGKYGIGPTAGRNRRANPTR